MEQRIWFITGISSGLGKELTQFLLDKGDFVIGTMRNQGMVEAFNQKHEGKAMALKLDLANPEEIQQVFQEVISKKGYIDVLVNNAGYGFGGAIEEADMQEIRSLFQVIFFGALELTKAFLPLFRERKKGHIIQISSHGGVKAFAGFGIYNASKFALEGFSEALAQELAPLGIHLSIVEPGPFRTGFAGGGFKMAQKKIEAYQQTSGVFREKIKAVDGQQEGDPAKAAAAIEQLSRMEHPPLRLPLGKIALATIRSKVDSIMKDLESGKDMAEQVVYGLED